MESIFRFAVVFSAIVFTPLILSVFIRTDYFLFSVYGICIALYSLVQVIFAYANRRSIERLTRRARTTNCMYNLLIVGYREDKDLFRKCLESMRHYLHDPKISKILVVIDGDSPEDEYMVDIFKSVFFADSVTIHGNIYITPVERAICVSQPHKGKRSALYTGFKFSDLMNVTGVICTDSDTVFCENAVKNLAKIAEYSDSIGAVTGNVEITNKSNFISFIFT